MRHRYIKFWPQDHQREPSLRMCSLAARGFWVELLAIAHDADPYGHVLVNGRAPEARELALIVGCGEKDAKRYLDELEKAGVFSRTAAGVIVSRRMVRDHDVSELGRKNKIKGLAVNDSSDGDAPSRVEDEHPSSPPSRGPKREAARGPSSLYSVSESEADTESESSLRSLSARADAPAGGTANLSEREIVLALLDEQFELWWQAYPRKVAKGQARRAYRAAIRRYRVTCDELLEAVRTYPFGHEERFIPHPTTWLNGERWRDERDTGDPVLRAAGLNDDGTLRHDQSLGGDGDDDWTRGETSAARGNQTIDHDPLESRGKDGHLRLVGARS